MGLRRPEYVLYIFYVVYVFWREAAFCGITFRSLGIPENEEKISQGVLSPHALFYRAQEISTLSFELRKGVLRIMLDGIFQSIKQKLKAENGVLKFCFVLIALVTIFNSMQIHRAMSMQRTIILPPNVHEKLEFTGDSASASTLRPYAIYIASLAFNYTPANVRGQFDELLTMYSSGSYEEAKKMYYDLADKVEAAVKVSSVFYPLKIYMLEKNRKIEITGIRRMFSDNYKTADEQKTYIIEYVIQDGRFEINKLYEKIKGDRDE